MNAERQSSLWRTGVLCLLAAGLLWFFRRRLDFDPRPVLSQLRLVSPAYLLLATATIYACYWLRAVRWAALLPGAQPARPVRLLASQLMGFTAVALFGRVADLGRPYLVARQLGTPVATQVGVYGIERTLDLAAAAAVFSGTLALAPHGLPHREAFARAGMLALAATLCLAAVLAAVRWGGERLASVLVNAVRPLSPRIADGVRVRLREFRQGFGGVSSGRRLLWAGVLSLAMWLGIALTYLWTAHAFRTSPQLAGLSFAGTVLLMATGIGGSVLQLPILGWFTQIAVLATALHALFNVPGAAATACASLLLLIANLAVVPAGLLAARLTHMPLRGTASGQVPVESREAPEGSARMGLP